MSQIDRKWIKIVGIASFIPAIIPNYWHIFFGFGTGGSAIHIQDIIPIILWAGCFLFINKNRSEPLKTYWWLSISLLLCSWSVIETLLTLAIWGIRGFAP